MSQAFPHEPVMATEVVDLFGPVPSGPGRRRHPRGRGPRRGAAQGHPEIRILGIDRDPAAVAAASGTLAPFGTGPSVRQSRFDVLGQVVARGAGRARHPDRRARAQRGPVRPRGQLAPAGRGRAGVLLPAGRRPGHEDGPDVGSDGRRRGQPVRRGRPGRAVRRQRRGPVRPAHRPGHRRRPTPVHHRPAGRRGAGRHPGRHPPNRGPSGPPGLPGHPDRRQRGARPAGAGPRRRPRPAAARRSVRGHRLPLRRGPAGQDRSSPAWPPTTATARPACPACVGPTPSSDWWPGGPGARARTRWAATGGPRPPACGSSSGCPAPSRGVPRAGGEVA